MDGERLVVNNVIIVSIFKREVLFNNNINIDMNKFVVAINPLSNAVLN